MHVLRVTRPLVVFWHIVCAKTSAELPTRLEAANDQVSRARPEVSGIYLTPMLYAHILVVYKLGILKLKSN